MNVELEQIIMKEIDTWDIQLRNNSSSIKSSQKAKFSLYELGIEAAKKIYAESKTIQKKKYLEKVDYSNFSFKEAIGEFRREYLLSQLKRHNNVPQEAAKASDVTCDAFRHYMMASKIKVREIRESLSKTDKPGNKFNPVKIAEKVIDSYSGVFTGRLKTLVSKNKKLIANRISDVVGDIIQYDNLDSNPDPSLGLYLQDDYVELNFEDAVSKFRKDYLKHMVNKHYCKNLRPLAEAIGVNYGAVRVTLTREGIRIKDVLSK